MIPIESSELTELRDRMTFQRQNHIEIGGRMRDNVKYLNLYRRLRGSITEGRYRFGEKLPSKRELAAENGVSVITVEHCLDLLTDEGYIEPRERSGCFVSYRSDETYPVEEALARPLRTAVNRHDEDFPFEALARIMRRVLTVYGPRILDRSPNAGIPELRRALSDYLRRSRGIQVDPEEIFIGSGSEYLYNLIVQMLGRSRIYGLENPSYEKISAVYTASGVRTEMLKLGQDGILSSELQRTAATVLHVTPFNSYPSGVTASASKRMEYIRWAVSRGGTLIEDDYDSEYCEAGRAFSTLYSMEPRQNVIYLNSFSKTISDSVRIAYMVLPSDRQEQLRAKIEFYSCTVPVFEQLALTELIDSGEFERHINRVRRMRRKMQ